MSKGQKNALPTLAPVEDVATVEQAVPQPQAAPEESPTADDIVYVTITIPVSVAPRGRLFNRIDTKLKTNLHRRVCRQIYDGGDSTRAGAMLGILESIDVELRKIGKSENRTVGKSDFPIE